MPLSKSEPDRTCTGCGATAADRLKNMPGETQSLCNCPHCGATKCCMCDLGDDVPCISCVPEA